jgi:hemerythrin-like domain-containing protein
VWNQVLETFECHLEPHFQIEEQHLLPGLEAIGEVSLASRIREDHDALRVLRNAETVNRSLLTRFGELLEAHIRYEERQVFEPTQHRISAKALNAIASACQSVPRACPASLEV